MYITACARSVLFLSYCLQNGNIHEVIFFSQVFTDDVQNIHHLLEYKLMACEQNFKLKEYCIFPHNLPQFDSERISCPAPERNQSIILKHLVIYCQCSVYT